LFPMKRELAEHKPSGCQAVRHKFTMFPSKYG
jgi:hypothetical protein